MSWIEDLPMDYVECRSLRHAWRRTAFGIASSEDLGSIKAPFEYNQIVKRESECYRCGTTRFELFGRSKETLRDFERFHVNYTYPKNYLFIGKEEEEPRPRFRDANREMFRRVTHGIR